MAEQFTIPTDIDFQFQVQIKEKDSFLNRDLTSMISAQLEVFSYDNKSSVFIQPMTVVDFANGILQCNLTAAQTGLLEAWTAPTADRAYIKAQYHATISVYFNDSMPVSVYIDQVYVTPTGV